MNKTLLKFTGLLFCFSVIDVLVILYWWMRCGQTQSAFYCDSFMFGGILLILGIPALILLGLSLIILAFSKWYKGNVSTVAKSMIIILGIIIFVAPFTPLLFSSEQPRTYRDFQIRMERGRMELEKEKKNKCIEYKQRISDYREGQPMPVPPPGCN
ncbi:MAG: hypothetical protein A3G59_00585 [Candidatus Taylorbacteria bacterium RIFCSPLOWO2_12_FULL_47_20]|uniref:Uncharacterized protein n=2 Tax=Candidatus Tayloriibacteriota TaxID=1817919 RepID=A0A1G2P753_9BACT|nr:MAG: hypothetical protein A3H68_01310 [Candidatus Taylorbacteria bacterium RIFCSPLOWO2_02_FULL_46_40]OHA44140.1 MAG: hypothetical protein A3G59_00585 [Candidatus Taylorbacteria bacterium RIFCSPLOWO2_12_FULL_47_20]